MYITRSFVEIKSMLEYDFNYFTGSHAAKTDLYLCHDVLFIGLFI